MEDTSAAEVEALAETTELVFVDVYAPWCAPCKQMLPVIEQLAENKHDIKFVKLDADENKDFCRKFGVRGIPTFIMLKRGEKTNMKTGVMSFEALEEFIKEGTK